MLTFKHINKLYRGRISSISDESTAILKYAFSTGPGKITLKGLNLNVKPPSFDKAVNNKHFDVAIIGGGSGGLAFAIEAQKLGLNAVIFDYVEPSPQGTKWGLGGTCVNVGCIPKKLMHTAALQKEHLLNSFDFGWNFQGLNGKDAHVNDPIFPSFEWKTLVKNIQMYIKSINFDYVSGLKQNETPYINNLAAFLDKNTLVYTSNKDNLSDFLKTGNYDAEKLGKLTADYIVVATGARPRLLDESDCKNSEKYAISSDDLFFWPNPPKKTLVVGGGYIALECAGFLGTIGYPVEVMNRTHTFLRGFDSDMTNMVINHMQRNIGIQFSPTFLPYNIEKTEDGRLHVKSRDKKSGKEKEDVYDTVLMAIGRTANTSKLNLERAGIKINPKSDKIVGGFNGDAERTSVENVFAVGDVLDGVPELTPVAQKSAQFLAKRIAINKGLYSDIKKLKFYTTDYNDYPTTVFTPLEYSLVGLSEEKAIELYGADRILVYHSRSIPLEESLNSRDHPQDGDSLKVKSYVKIVCDKQHDEKVIGIHYVGPNAGEVMQGYTVAIKLGVRKEDLDRTIGIHPTTAEEFVLLKKTKAEDPDKTSC